VGSKGGNLLTRVLDDELTNESIPAFIAKLQTELREIVAEMEKENGERPADRPHQVPPTEE
jgi:hypothetical protein